jgi:hypothetical protein
MVTVCFTNRISPDLPDLDCRQKKRAIWEDRSFHLLMSYALTGSLAFTFTGVSQPKRTSPVRGGTDHDTSPP